MLNQRSSFSSILKAFIVVSVIGLVFIITLQSSGNVQVYLQSKTWLNLDNQNPQHSTIQRDGQAYSDQDYTDSGTLHNSSTLANKHPKISPSLLIFVHSSLQDFSLRYAVRKTWGSIIQQQKYNFVIQFVIGHHRMLEEENFNRAFQEEKGKFHDIITVNVVESYANLTVKSLEMLKWCSENCHKYVNLSYVIKMDDDVFLNIPHLISVIENSTKFDNDSLANMHENNEYFMIGKVLNNSIPIRKRYSKYYMPPGLYSRRKYPPYLSGSLYIIPIALVPELVSAANKIKSKLWLEDVFITGILPRYCKRKNISLINHNGFNLSKRHLINYLSGNCKQSSITIHGVTGLEIQHLWKFRKGCS